jgi:acetyltransferase-like isoleucine patch superfamily enzyme
VRECSRPSYAATPLPRELTGRAVDESVTVIPPFYSEFGNNLTPGKDLFINIGCRLWAYSVITLVTAG